MTKDGWRRLVLNVTNIDDTIVSDRIQNGYIARDKEAQYQELAAMVVPERYR